MPSSARRWSMLMAAPKHRRGVESTLAMNREAGEALIDRHQLDRVDVKVRRQVGDPPEKIGVVLGGKRIDAAVQLVRRLFVSTGTNDGELGLGHSGLNGGYANPGAVEVRTQVERKLTDESLRAAVHRAALVRIVRRDGRQVDDRTFPLDQLGKQ